MKEVDIVSKIVNREGGTFVPSSKGTQPIDLSDYLLKSIWDKVWEIRTDSQGTEYIFGKLPVVTQYGITMYSGGNVDVPSLASGLPFDGRTIWYNPDTQQIEVIGGTGGGSGEGVSNFWDLSGIPSWITNSKPKYTYSEIEGTPDLTKYALVSQIPSLSGYATESWVLQKNYATKATTLSGYGITDAYTKTNVDDLLKSYVTLGGTQTITGEKNFVGGLKVNGSPIYYDTEKKYWKLEGDLLITGGVTMYGNEGTYTPSTIMDAIAVDGTTISKSGGVLKVIGGTGGGVADSVAWANITGKPTWIGSSKPSYAYSEITGAISTTELQNYLTQNSYLNVTGGDNRYLMLSGGTITGSLEIKCGADNKIIINNTDGEGYSRIVFQENGSYIGQLLSTKDGNIHWGESKIWHSGNDGNGSGLDADLLDGKQPSELNVNSATKLVSGTSDILTINSTKGVSIKTSSFSAGNNTEGLLYLKTTSSRYGNRVIEVSAPNLEAGSQGMLIYMGVAESKYNGGYMRYMYNGLGLSNNALTLGFWGADDLFSLLGNGNIGIGTISPAYKLDVNGTIRFSSKTLWGQSFDGTGNVSGALSDVTGITFKNDYYGLVIDELGNFSFKKPYSTAAVDWSFKDSSGNKLMIINNSGNVGIGTANPLHKLHIYSAVNQSLCIEQKFSSNWSECIIAHNSSLSSGQHYSLCIGHSDTTKNRGVLAYYHNGEGSDNNRFCLGLHGVDDVVNVLGNGNVGIGTTSPTSKLEVSGAVKANYYDVSTTRQASLSGSYTLGCGMYGSSIQHSVSDGYTLPALMWSAKSPNGNSSQFSIMSYHPPGATGYLIIGVAKNGTRTAFIEVQGDGVIQAGGDFLASGGITMYSDQRKKTILSHVELSLKDIANAPLIEHYYNSDEKKTTHVGSIAQYWASMNDWFCKLDSEGYYTMEIQNAALASAISIARELDRYESKTDKAIKKLKKRICELEEEVERLKSA